MSLLEGAVSFLWSKILTRCGSCKKSDCNLLNTNSIAHLVRSCFSAITLLKCGFGMKSNFDQMKLYSISYFIQPLKNIRSKRNTPSNYY